MTFDYRVYTNYFNHTVLLQVVDCDMETDKNGNCFYDTLTIHDGKLSSYSLLTACWRKVKHLSVLQKVIKLPNALLQFTE